MKAKILTALLVVFLVLFMAGCSFGSTDDANGKTDKTSESSETIKIAYPVQPQTLDPHVTTANATRDLARVMFESLVTLNENYEVVPQLAKSFKFSEGRKTLTFKLREGIKFHNGEEMKAKDVVASMEKWSGSSAMAKANLGPHKWVVVDDYTVKLTLENSSSILLYTLADQSQVAAIMPKEIIESAGDTGVEKYIGTGPYKFVEWKKDQYVHFTKYENYSPDSAPASGLAGEKNALINNLYWHFVTDGSTRVTGLVSGQYDFSHMLSYDSVEQVKNTPGKVVKPWKYGIEVLVFNKKQGLFTNVKARKAVNYALDMEAVMKSAFTDEKYYDLDPGLFLPSQTNWYTDAGKDIYDNQDVDKAKELLNEIGYDGEEVIILTSRDYAHHYNAAVATQQQLQQAGINAKLEVYDWATLLERRSKPNTYDIFFTGYPVLTIPHQYVFLDSEAEWPGWTNIAEIDKLLNQITTVNSQEKAKEMYAQIQQIMWEQLPVINVGKNSRISAYSENIQGYKNFLGPVFWNTTIKK